MRCPTCNSENPAEAKFCDECSTVLASSCPACGVSNRPDAKFCRGCGSPLASPPVTARFPTEPHPSFLSRDGPTKPSAESQELKAERRHLTLLFCDLAGSTGITALLDPEDWRDLSASYLSATVGAIERFGGHVAKNLGDGLVAYFGYPQAHDDDPRRAVLAGLAILETVDALNQEPANRRRPSLTVRIGVDKGLVVVDRTNAKDVEVYGESPNIAARVQTAAGRNMLLITSAVHRLVSGLFLVEDQGEQHLKGIERPLHLFRVVQPSGVRDRLAAAALRGLTPFVGREDELRLLLSRWNVTSEGEGQLILILGEAGIGKSRLVQRFREQIADTPHMWISCAAASLHQNTSFYAISEMLQQCIRARADERDEQSLGAALETLLEQAGVKLEEGMPLLAPLMNLTPPPKYPPLAMSPERQRQRLLAAIAALTMGTAGHAPLVIAIEDLHWADPSTLEALQLLAEQCSAASLMLICTARSEFQAPWAPRPNHTQLTLNRLNRPSSREMVARLAEGSPLASDTVDLVVERSDGVPLFVEELTRSILENESAGPSLSEIPATLHDSLMARLDRLGKAREVAQLASVIGHEFSWGLLRAVAGPEDAKLESALRTLTDAEILSVEGIPPLANYRFRHALIQDAAYQTLLRSKRKQYHRQIAKALELDMPGTAEAQPELLAHHFTEADLKNEAIAQWHIAGHKALQRSANAEAINHLSKALELLATFPETLLRAQQELELQITLGVPLMATKGYAAPEVEKVFSRAWEVYQQIGNSPRFFPMLVGVWAFRSLRAQYTTAYELTEQLMSLAQSSQDPALLVEAHTARGNTLSFLGELNVARGHLEQAIAIYDRQQHRSHAYSYGQDPCVHSLSYATLVLWLLGYPDQARRRSLEALALAEELSHAFSVAFALIHIVYTHRFCLEVEETLQAAKQLITFSTEQGFPIPLAVGAAHQGWALAQQRMGEEGVSQIQQAIDTWRATGSTLYYQPFMLAMLAEAQGKAGSPKQGMTTLVEALSIVNATGERFWEPELYRLNGDLTLQSELQIPSKTQDEAEGLYRMAIRTAQRLGAKSLELRAVMSLSRMLARQGRNAEGRQMLANIYGWFSEGFGTGDLMEAKALLKEAF